MDSVEQLRVVLEDLVGVMHAQAKEIEKLIVHVERQNGALPDPNEVPLIISELSELHQRVKKLAGATSAS